VAPFSAQDVES